MKEIFKIEVVEKCWKDSLIWMFELIDVLNAAHNENEKITDLEKSKDILKQFKEKNEEIKHKIKSEIQKIEIHVKPVRNFQNSLEKLLNSTEIDFSKKLMKIPPKPFDLFESIEIQDLTELELSRYIGITKRNLEINWIAFNQAYSRMIIKMKLNGYRIE